MDTNLIQIARLMAGNQEPTIPFIVQLVLLALAVAFAIVLWLKLSAMHRLIQSVPRGPLRRHPPRDGTGEWYSEKWTQPAPPPPKKK